MRRTNKYVLFWGGILSQWAMSPFQGRDAWSEMRPLLESVGFVGPDEETEISRRLRNSKYSSAEKWMMAVKAWAFNDLTTLRNILEVDDPKTIKALGRKVANFDAKVWDIVGMPAVTAGSIAKFGATERMTRELLDTGDLIIVESSPYDVVWGTGIDWRRPEAEDPTKWRGQNRLGQCLMEARRVLRERSAT